MTRDEDFTRIVEEENRDGHRSIDGPVAVEAIHHSTVDVEGLSCGDFGGYEIDFDEAVDLDREVRECLISNPASCVNHSQIVSQIIWCMDSQIVESWLGARSQCRIESRNAVHICRLGIDDDLVGSAPIEVQIDDGAGNDGPVSNIGNSSIENQGVACDHDYRSRSRFDDEFTLYTSEVADRVWDRVIRSGCGSELGEVEQQPKIVDSCRDILWYRERQVVGSGGLVDPTRGETMDDWWRWVPIGSWRQAGGLFKMQQNRGVVAGV